jgi:hypothetical protein
VLLTKIFSDEQFERALESWNWIGLDGKQPALASLFGDIFFAAPDGWWYLSLLDGSLTRRWADRDAVQNELDTDDGQDEFLLGGMAMAAEARGLRLQPNEVYAFTIPPILGGQVTTENVQTMDFDVALTITGQLHRQVRDLPPGTRISGFSLDPGT